MTSLIIAWSSTVSLSSTVPAPPAPPARKLISFHSDDYPYETLGKVFHYDFEDPSADSPCPSPRPPSKIKTSTREPLTEFTKFTNLCFELRLKIWAHAYADLEPRMLSIVPPHVAVPPLLQACFESRKVGLGIYKRQEHSATPSLPAFISVVDFEKDIIDLTAQRAFTNPQPAFEVLGLYIYSEFLLYNFNYDNNLLLYMTHHYPKLCQHIKLLMVHSSYLSLAKVLPHAWSPVADFFQETFPVVESVGLLSGKALGKGSVRPPKLNATQRLRARRNAKALKRIMSDLDKAGRLKYIRY